MLISLMEPPPPKWVPFQGRHLGLFPGKPGFLFTVGLLKEIDQ